MKIEIKKRWSNEVIKGGEAENLRDFLEKNKTANLRGANLSGANLSGANLSWADLSGADLSGADLFGANLSEANLSRANLSGADLSGADLSGADLFGANLSEANLSRANLSEANLSRANLSEANLSRADLSGANLSKIKNYAMSHDIAIQLGKNNLDKFTIKQQEISSRIFTLQLCWPEIKKQYGDYMTAIFKIIADLGWDEYLKKWEEVKKEKS